VIDFIDMEYGSNVRKVEKAMKDALKDDRARIQVGRISGFGLMEMSRQRLRTGVLEASTRSCPHCDGTGLVRTASSAGLSALRLIEDEAAKGKGTTITLYASTEAAVYLLNAKRRDLREIEERYGVTVEVLPEGEQEGAKMRVASSGPRPTSVPRFEPIADEVEDDFVEESEEDEEEFEAREERPERGGRAERDDEGRGKRRRRRRGGRGRDREDRPEGEETAGEEPRGEPAEEFREEETATGEDRPKKRRRRGGRRRRRGGEFAEGEEGLPETAGFEGAEAAEAIAEVAAEWVPEADTAAASPEEAADVLPEEQPAPAPKPRSRRRKPAVSEAEEAVSEAAETAAPVEAEAAPKPRARRKKADAEVASESAVAIAEAAVAAEPAKPRRSRKKASEPEAPAAEPVAAEAAPANDVNGDEADDGEPRRGGWWQRTFGQ
jgi:ribonuclease E